MRTETTIEWFHHSFPVIKWLTEHTALVAHPNGPALCDGDWLQSITPHQQDSQALLTIKGKACDAYRELTWPQLVGKFYPSEGESP